MWVFTVHSNSSLSLFPAHTFAQSGCSAWIAVPLGNIQLLQHRAPPWAAVWISTAEQVLSIGFSSPGKKPAPAWAGSLWVTVPIRKHPAAPPWALSWATGNNCFAAWSSSLPAFFSLTWCLLQSQLSLAWGSPCSLLTEVTPVALYWQCLAMGQSMQYCIQ